ncbi:hypothetical protein D3C80_1766250 [compost metagenome]
MYHLESRRTTVDDDAVAFFAKRNSFASNRALAIRVFRFRNLERSACKAAELRGMDSLRAAANPLDTALHVKRCNVAPKGRFRRLRQFHQILNGDHRLFLNSTQDDAVALSFVHGSSLSLYRA